VRELSPQFSHRIEGTIIVYLYVPWKQGGITMRTECIGCVKRYLLFESNHTHSLKQLAEIFNADPSNLDRRFRQVEGTTIKKAIDKYRKRMLLSLLKSNNRYGYEMAAILGFVSDHSFYRWVKRVFGRSFIDLRMEYNEKLVEVRQESLYQKP
jgi:AraC-like DNA-binding protein